MFSRRQFSKLILGSGALASSNLRRAFALPAAQNAIQDCDSLIKGGTVVDPGQGLHAMLDVAVKDGKILELSPNILAARARYVFSAKGKIVSPGIIDVHVHVTDA